MLSLNLAEAVSARIGLILLVELVLAFISVPIAVKLGHTHGFTDKPDQHLKLHAEETPHIGGLVVFSLILSVSVAYHVFVSPLTSQQMINVGLLGVIFITGMTDDHYHLPVGLRLVTQFMVVILLILSGNIFTPTDVFAFNVFLTIVGTLAMINALNMLDGMDGLAGIVSFFAILGLIYTLGYYSVGMFYITIGAAAIVVLIPFLVANFRPNPKKAFLGDGGSTSLGFLIALLFIHATNARGESDTVASMSFISIPVFEFSFATMLRICAGKNPLKGSKDHFPLKMRHLLGGSHPKTIFYISFLALFSFLSGIGILHLSTGFKYVMVALGSVVYLFIWLRLVRVKVD